MTKEQKQLIINNSYGEYWDYKMQPDWSEITEKVNKLLEYNDKIFFHGIQVDDSGGVLISAIEKINEQDALIIWKELCFNEE